MQCSWCGRELPDDARFCASCGRDLRPPPPEETAPEGAAIAIAAPVITAAAPIPKSRTHPWLRYWARSFDLFSFLLILTLAGILRADSYIQSVLALYLTVPIEAVLLALFGTTPGKWLFRISVEDEVGGRPAFGRAMRRAFGVLVYGMGLLLPMVSMIAQVIAYMRLADTGITIWDERAGTRVQHGVISPLRAVFIFLVFFTFIAVLAVMGYLATQAGGQGTEI